jgi:hypothetical protein
MNGKHKVNWGQVDWHLQDIEIADRFGCSRERVRQARKEPGLGGGQQSDKPRSRTGETAKNILARTDTKGRTLVQLAATAGCDTHRAGKLLRELGKSFKRRPRGGQIYRWGHFPENWRELTDKEIASMVGAKYGDIVAQWRARHGYIRGEVVEKGVGS